MGFLKISPIKSANIKYLSIVETFVQIDVKRGNYHVVTPGDTDTVPCTNRDTVPPGLVRTMS